MQEGEEAGGLVWIVQANPGGDEAGQDGAAGGGDVGAEPIPGGAVGAPQEERRDEHGGHPPDPDLPQGSSKASTRLSLMLSPMRMPAKARPNMTKHTAAMPRAPFRRRACRPASERVGQGARARSAMTIGRKPPLAVNDGRRAIAECTREPPWFVNRGAPHSEIVEHAPAGRARNLLDLSRMGTRPDGAAADSIAHPQRSDELSFLLEPSKTRGRSRKIRRAYLLGDRPVYSCPPRPVRLHYGPFSGSR